MRVIFGSSPSATIEQHKSRSVIIPRSSRESWSVTTGNEPTFPCNILLATDSAVSVGRQQIAFGVISSRTFILAPPKLLPAEQILINDIAEWPRYSRTVKLVHFVTEFVARAIRCWLRRPGLSPRPR